MSEEQTAKGSHDPNTSIGMGLTFGGQGTSESPQNVPGIPPYTPIPPATTRPALDPNLPDPTNLQVPPSRREARTPSSPYGRRSQSSQLASGGAPHREEAPLQAQQVESRKTPTTPKGTPPPKPVLSAFEEAGLALGISTSPDRDPLGGTIPTSSAYKHEDIWDNPYYSDDEVLEEETPVELSLQSREHVNPCVTGFVRNGLLIVIEALVIFLG